MSEDLESVESDTDILCCASCGIAEVDDIKLKDCDACKLIRYCVHRPHYEQTCQERAAELHDEIFRQPESSHRGDCPICLLSLSLDSESVMMTCCSKMVCLGCDNASPNVYVRWLLALKYLICKLSRLFHFIIAFTSVHYGLQQSFLWSFLTWQQLKGFTQPQLDKHRIYWRKKRVEVRSIFCILSVTLLRVGIMIKDESCFWDFSLLSIASVVHYLDR